MSTMQKSLIFLLIVWNISPFASGNSPTNHLQFSLGCQAVIPCQHCRRGSGSFKWYYKKDERSGRNLIFAQEGTGIERYQQRFQSRISVLNNRSLVINDLTEDDQGLYWCEGDCLKEQAPTVTSVKKEILKETNETFYVTAGRNFTYACPGEFNNLKWTFEGSKTTALRNSAQRPESYFVTSNKSLHIVKVQRADVGEYSCWKSRCDGHWQKLFTITLCIVTVHHSENSAVSCAVMCDVEFSTSNVETNTRRVNVDPYGFLNCTTKQMFDGYSNIHTVNSTHEPSNASNKTTDVPTQPVHVILIYGTSAALTCLILMALLVCYLRPRLRAAFSIKLCCCGSNGSVEEMTSVVYSSIIIRPAKTTDNYVSNNECVYSEIKV